jgi:hypothetical protein
VDVTTERAIYEKLGSFYLGKKYDLEQRTRLDELVLYDSKDLVTHAVIVGMTGSGKTGLGIGLIEEGALDGIPVVIVDPKGDMANMLLTFPHLQPGDFAPWIHEDDAARAGVSPLEFATQQSEVWRKGLADWGQPIERIQSLRDAAEFAVYTPGSDAGIPVSILSSFAAPQAALRNDSDLFRDRISTTATGLLTLLGLDTDPLRSREHILLTTILEDAWRKGQNLDLGTIIRLVQNPPLASVGVMDLESFYPSKDRFTLSMTLNNLLAAPGFSTWMSGEALDMDRMLYTPAGKPRVSIFSIAHLSDSERMFFVSLLLNQMVGWMRTQSGTSSLRAMLYFDEIFGYMPPVAEPPTKKPLLTLLKQARAFGLGVILATQNPVDLDYKGLSNTGTWFIGRLQTERDKDRVLDGLEGAAADSGGTFDRSTISDILSNLGKRVFLLHNVHESVPVVFQTRWTLSYLAGPMTRNQIKKLVEPHKQTVEPMETDSAPSPRPVGERPLPSNRPLLPPEITQVFLPVRSPVTGGELVYQPKLLGSAKVHFVDSRKDLSADEDVVLLVSVENENLNVDWSAAEELDLTDDDLEREPLKPASFGQLSSALGQLKSYGEWRKSLSEHLYRTRRFNLYRSTSLEEISEPHESERDFRIRLVQQARERRDAEVEKLRQKYAPKVRVIEDRIRRAEQRVELEKQEASSTKMQSAISFGATVLGAVFGRKLFSSTTIGRAGAAARGMGRVSKQSADVSRAVENLNALQEDLRELESQIEEETNRIGARLDPLSETLGTIQLKPRRADVNVRFVALAWVPCLISQEQITQELR